MWIQISSGKGPAECELAVGLFLNRFLKEFANQDIGISIVATTAGFNNDAYKSVLLSIRDIAAINIKTLNGTILWICQSPLRPDHKRKNWFFNVEVFNEPESAEFYAKDVKFEAMRSSGPGGQNVNKVETAVRAIHLLTGLTTVANEERTQYLNKRLALAKLVRLIEMVNEKGTLELKKELWNQHNLLARGNPVRAYEGKDFRLRVKNI